jgi:hypothetical protein
LMQPSINPKPQLTLGSKEKNYTSEFNQLSALFQHHSKSMSYWAQNSLTEMRGKSNFLECEFLSSQPYIATQTHIYTHTS